MKPSDLNENRILGELLFAPGLTSNSDIALNQPNPPHKLGTQLLGCFHEEKSFKPLLFLQGLEP